MPSYDYLNREGRCAMARRIKAYKQISCRDFGADCDFLVRAENEEEIMTYGHDHACYAHGKCASSSEADKKMKSFIKNARI